MAPRVVDISGKRFGRLTVIGRVLRKGARDSIWQFVCECGKTGEVTATNLRRTASCGCLRNELKTTHGGARRGQEDDLYKIWAQVIQRCTNPKCSAYPNYGGRGISVCDGWLSFATFRSDMGARPTKAHSIERIDNSGNYEPTNCRWATMKEQCANRRPGMTEAAKAKISAARKRYWQSKREAQYGIEIREV